MSYNTRQTARQEHASEAVFPVELKENEEKPIRGMILVRLPSRLEASGEEAKRGASSARHAKIA
jgi:hypothetical protein